MEPFLEPLEYALPTPLLDQSSIVPEISLFCQKKRKKIKEDATKTIIIARKSILLSLSMCTLSSGVPTCDFFSFDTWQGQSRNFINIALTLTKPRGQVAVILYISSNVK